MNKLNIRLVARKRQVFRSTPKTEIYHSYGNVLNRQFIASQPNQKWVTDVTHISTRQGWAYLSTIKDLFDRLSMSHQLGRMNSLELVLYTLKQARHSEEVTDGLLLHSDHGHQYTSHGYAVPTRQLLG